MTAEPEKERSKFYVRVKSIYFFIAGNEQSRNILSFKYLTTYKIYPAIREHAAGLQGNILDFGCGKKPYRDWFTSASSYRGIDIYPGEHVDDLLTSKTLPYKDDSFDHAFSNQVFEHMDSLSYISELARVTKEGGSLVVLMPFLYHEHEDIDHRRFTAMGLTHALETRGFTVLEHGKLGGIGSTSVLLMSYFIDDFVKSRKGILCTIIKPLFLVWYVLMPAINCWGMLMDKLDKSGKFYNNQIVIARNEKNNT